MVDKGTEKKETTAEVKSENFSSFIDIIIIICNVWNNRFSAVNDYLNETHTWKMRTHFTTFGLGPLRLNSWKIAQIKYGTCN